MIRTHLRKVLGDLRKYRSRTALVSTSIFIGVLGTVSLFSMGDIIVRQLEQDIKPDRIAMLTVSLRAVDIETIENPTHLDVLQATPQLTILQAYADYEIDLRLDAADVPVLIRAYSNTLSDLKIEPVRLLDGDYPDSGEVAITQAFAHEHDLAIGSTLTIDERDWPISGIVFPSYYRPQPGRRVSVFTNWADLQVLTNRRDFTGLQARFTSYAAAEDYADSFVQTLVQQTPYIPIAKRLTDPAENEMIEEARTNGNVLGMLAMIALLVSGFLVANVISSLLTEQRSQLGIMKTLGGSRVDLFGIYLGIAACYGLLGIIPGILLGIPLGSLAANQLSGTLGTYLDGFGISPISILYGVVLGLVVPMAAAVFPIWRSTRMPILKAITNRGIETTYGAGFVARFIARLPLLPTMRQSLNNLNRKKVRLAFTVVTMTVAVAAFMGIFAVLDSVLNLITSALDTVQADIIVQLDDPADFDRAFGLLNTHLDGLKSVQPGSQIAIEIEGYDPSSSIGPEGVFASGFDPYADALAYHIALKAGTLWNEDTPSDGIIITQRMAESIGLEVGDRISVHAAGQQGSFPVIGISTYPFDGIYMDWQVLARFVGFVSDGQPVSGSAIVIMQDDNLTATELDAVIDDMKTVLGAEGIHASYQNFPARSALILSRVEMFRAIFSLAILFVAMIGGLGLLTTLTISVFERQREIGIMRSIGGTSVAIGVQFLTEGLAVGMVAWLLGIPLSLGLSMLLSSAMSFGDAFRLVYPIEAVIFGGLGMIGVTILASLYPALSAAHKPVSEILRYQ